MVNGWTVFWQEHVVDGSRSLVWMDEDHTDETASSLKESANISCLVYLRLLKVLKNFCRFLIDHGHSVVALWSVVTSEKSTDAEDKDAAIKHSDILLYGDVPFSHELTLTSRVADSDSKLKVFHKAMQSVLGSVNDTERPECQSSICDKQWTCHPWIASNSSPTPEQKSMSGVKRCGTL